jgi:N utilization substance protein A
MAELELRAKAKENIPEPAFDMPLEELNYAEGLTRLLSEAGNKTVGDLMLRMELNSDAILSLNGIGPKAMEKIEQSLAEVTFPEPVIEEPVEVEGEAIDEAPIPGTDIAEEVSEPEAEETEKTDAEVTPDEEMVPAAEVDVVEKDIQAETSEEGEEETSTLEEIFALKPDAFDVDLTATDFEEEDEEETDAKKKKKEKKKKYVEMEYDPDQDVVIVKRKRKRDSEDWEEDWEL